MQSNLELVGNTVSNQSFSHKKAMKLVKALLAYDVEVRLMDTSGYKDIGEMPPSVYHRRKEDAPFIDSDAYLFKIALMA